ncbi:MAG: zf-HC2 domain-containing protein [Betaproteobacteria bacterium]|nr:MAG: zf-HC2 domain-containing protein [Betaproteobacteria bacterium]
MNCHEAGIWLGAYADGHVGALRRYSIQRHLRACTGCAVKHQGLLALRARLRAEAPYFKAPPLARARSLLQRSPLLHSMHGGRVEVTHELS